MPKQQGEKSDGTPVTVEGASKWGNVFVGLVSGAFVAGATYMAAKSDIAQARERADAAVARVVAIEQKAAKVEILESQQKETVEKMDRILEGLESVDRKLFALVCKSDPKKCDDYRPAVQR